MIGLNYLGRMGHLVNQMFQYAALKGIATWNGYEYVFPYNSQVLDDGIGNKLRIELFDAFKIKHEYYGVLNTQKEMHESHFHFDDKLFDTCPDDSCLIGFFQTPKYFDHIESQIREDFTFHDGFVKDCQLMLDLVEDPIAIHIRRGDFLINSGNHYNLSLSYYKNALDEFGNDRQVVIFSDDPQWCKEQELFADDRFLVSEGNGPYHDLYMMTQCSDFIIGNSTYSWWGAWLCNNPDKIVIYPDKWFGPNNQNNSTKDLFPKGWRMINEN